MIVVDPPGKVVVSISVEVEVTVTCDPGMVWTDVTVRTGPATVVAIVEYDVSVTVAVPGRVL